MTREECVKEIVAARGLGPIAEAELSALLARHVPDGETIDSWEIVDRAVNIRTTAFRSFGADPLEFEVGAYGQDQHPDGSSISIQFEDDAELDALRSQLVEQRNIAHTLRCQLGERDAEIARLRERARAAEQSFREADLRAKGIETAARIDECLRGMRAACHLCGEGRTTFVDDDCDLMHTDAIYCDAPAFHVRLAEIEREKSGCMEEIDR